MVVIVWPFFVIFVVFVRSADRERCDVRVGDAERDDDRDDGRGKEFRPSFTLNFTLNIFLNDFAASHFVDIQIKFHPKT